MITVSEAIIVEGKYDKNTLSQIVNAVIVDTSGFGIFNDGEKLSLFRRLAEKTGIVVFTDSDGAGFVIRNYIKSSVQTGKVLHAYIPDIFGKERRKKSPSAEGKLGVEGMTADIIVDALRKSGATIDGENSAEKRTWLSKADMFEMGLSGTAGSAERRRRLLKELSFPEHTSPNVLLELLNALTTEEELKSLLAKIEEAGD